MPPKKTKTTTAATKTASATAPKKRGRKPGITAKDNPKLARAGRKKDTPEQRVERLLTQLTKTHKFDMVKELIGLFNDAKKKMKTEKDPKIRTAYWNQQYKVLSKLIQYSYPQMKTLEVTDQHGNAPVINIGLLPTPSSGNTTEVIEQSNTGGFIAYDATKKATSPPQPKVVDAEFVEVVSDSDAD